jgi:hypothetical protein
MKFKKINKPLVMILTASSLFGNVGTVVNAATAITTTENISVDSYLSEDKVFYLYEDDVSLRGGGQFNFGRSDVGGGVHVTPLNTEASRLLTLEFNHHTISNPDGSATATLRVQPQRLNANGNWSNAGPARNVTSGQATRNNTLHWNINELQGPGRFRLSFTATNLPFDMTRIRINSGRVTGS